MRRKRNSFKKEKAKFLPLILSGQKTCEQVARELKLNSKFGKYQVQRWVETYSAKRGLMSTSNSNLTSKDHSLIDFLKIRLADLQLENERLKEEVKALKSTRKSSHQRPATL